MLRFQLFILAFVAAPNLLDLCDGLTLLQNVIVFGFQVLLESVSLCCQMGDRVSEVLQLGLSRVTAGSGSKAHNNKMTLYSELYWSFSIWGPIYRKTWAAFLSTMQFSIFQHILIWVEGRQNVGFLEFSHTWSFFSPYHLSGNDATCLIPMLPFNIFFVQIKMQNTTCV